MSIFPPFEAFYIEMLLWHATSAKASIETVNRWIDLVRADDKKALELEKPQLFGHLQNVVQQAGAISRYFWPSKPGTNSIHENRAIRLRAGFQVGAASPLKLRGLRNGLEHFDERLDLYLTQNVVGEFIPEYVDYVEPKREIPTHIFKAFYVSPMKFSLLTESYELVPVFGEILRLHHLLENCVANGCRLPP
jgi:hypothetical protein